MADQSPRAAVLSDERIADERARFEAYFGTSNPGAVMDGARALAQGRAPQGSYWSNWAQSEWCGWRARAVLAAADSARAVDAGSEAPEHYESSVLWWANAMEHGGETTVASMLREYASRLTARTAPAAAQSEPVLCTVMPVTGQPGITVALFNADEVPVGSKLYIAPVAQAEPGKAVANITVNAHDDGKGSISWGMRPAGYALPPGTYALGVIATPAAEAPAAAPQAMPAGLSPHAFAYGLACARTVDAAVEALRRLTFAARTTGGTPGPDAELMAACEQAETVLAAAPKLAVAQPAGETQAADERAEFEAWAKRELGLDDFTRSSLFPDNYADVCLQHAREGWCAALARPAAGAGEGQS